MHSFLITTLLHYYVHFTYEENESTRTSIAQVSGGSGVVGNTTPASALYILRQRIQHFNEKMMATLTALRTPHMNSNLQSRGENGGIQSWSRP